MKNQDKLIQTIDEGIDYELSELLMWNRLEDFKNQIRNARIEGYKEGYIKGYQLSHPDEDDINTIKKVIKLLEDGCNYDYISKVTNKQIYEIEKIDKKFFSKEEKSNELLFPKCYTYLDRYRIKNALLFFKLPEFEEDFVLFTLGDHDDFSFDNIIEEQLRLAYVMKDKKGLSYIKPIKDDKRLNAANKKAREYLYNENCLVRIFGTVLTYE